MLCTAVFNSDDTAKQPTGKRPLLIPKREQNARPKPGVNRSHASLGRSAQLHTLASNSNHDVMHADGILS